MPQINWTDEDRADPYSAAVDGISKSLEFALDDGMSGQMNQKEFEILDAVAKTLVALDPAIRIEPRVG